MPETLREHIGGVLDFWRGRGRQALRGRTLEQGLEKLRDGLLEADVALGAVQTLVEKTRAQAQHVETAAGASGVPPAQRLTAILYEALVETLGGDASPSGDSRDSRKSRESPEQSPGPEAILKKHRGRPLVLATLGLQGSGKTTSLAKMAYFFQTEQNQKVLLVSLDFSRPAARTQLAQLAAAHQVPYAALDGATGPEEAGRLALEQARRDAIDVLLLDTAGRQSVDEASMDALERLFAVVRPARKLLVVDGLSGQDAAFAARAFHQRFQVSDLVLTRMDGDVRGGAALSVRHVTGQPIRWLGVGEKIDDWEPFRAEKLAKRILGMNDVEGLVRKIQKKLETQESETLARRLQKGQFNLEDMALQLKQMRRMGGAGALFSFLPGYAKKAENLKNSSYRSDLEAQEAILNAMTRAEKRNPGIILSSRKIRIAKGSGRRVSDVNRLLKNYGRMAKWIKASSGKATQPLPEGLGGFEGSPADKLLGAEGELPFGHGGHGDKLGLPGLLPKAGPQAGLNRLFSPKIRG